MAKRKSKPATETAARNVTTITVKTPRLDSFRVKQVEGMFDLQPKPELVETFNVELPGKDEPWQIGCIVGPSGSGKSTVARHAFGQELYAGREWPADRAVVDCFDLREGAAPAEALRSIKEITGMLTAVGFSSPPSWVKPYAVLSNGEKFRCDLARALLEAGGEGRGTGENASRLVVFDEFTSVVDRTVAKIGSAAVAKCIRRLNSPSSPDSRPSPPPPPLRFVAVTCHYDVVEWLAPDWVLDMQSQTLARGSLRRPGITLDVFQTKSQAIWNLFKKHHYLSHSIPSGARFYVACVEHQPAALCVVGNLFGKCCAAPPFRGVRVISRLVTLPDFQGVGIGGVLLDAVGELLAADGLQARITTSHPGMMARLQHAPAWKVTRFALGTSKRAVSAAARARFRATEGSAFLHANCRYVCSAKFRAPDPGP